MLKALAFAALLAAGPAFAASQGTPAPTETITAPTGGPDRVMPDIPADETTRPSSETTGPTGGAVGAPPDMPIPVVEYDPGKLPVPVRRLREQLIEAASTGEPEKLRPIFDANGELPEFSDNDVTDPIDYLKTLSGDADGREILAILIEILDAGYVHVDAGTPDEMYVWPYFARYPIDKLTPRQMVELFKIVFAGDYEDMKAAGEYLFYSIGITPDGRISYLRAGD